MNILALLISFGCAGVLVAPAGSSCRSWGCSLAAVSGLLMRLAVAEAGSRSTLVHMGSVVVAPGL